jgi:molecular chaperone HtpG
MSNTTSQPQKFEFQAEIRQLLDIVIHSLYTEKEIFVRELVSNASDALEKLRHLQLTEKEIFDDRLPLEINITTDETAKTLTIQDFGVGMTGEELIQNLGTIAHSGSKAFLKSLSEGARKDSRLIGQFGVGFYSAFMVAKEVRFYTHSWRKESEGHVWTSDGGGSYSVEPSEGQRRGAKIVITLKDECAEFSKAHRIRELLRKYSNFVPFSINLNGEKVNTVEAIWLRSKSEVKDEEYTEFYKFVAHAWDEPRYKLHFSADAPLTINSILFVPKENTERLGFGRQEPGVHLYCRRVLIEDRPKDLLPEWMRFTKGVVDSEDLPLNVSRELTQDKALIEKLGRIITKRFLKFLEDEAKERPDAYNDFHKQFAMFLKEGAAMDFQHKEALSKLLRFESTHTDAGALTGFSDYVSRMKDGQKDIYYLTGQSRASIEAGPYLEAFKARGLEVILCTEPVDEFVMNALREFDGKRIVAADQGDLELPDVAPEGDRLSEEDEKALCTWLQETLGSRAHKVVSSRRLVGSPAMVLNDDKMMSVQMRRMMRAMGQDSASALRVNLEINPSHALIRQLNILRTSNPAVAGLVAEQILDNALAAAGLLEDPKDMITRSYRILEQLTKGN